MSDLNLPPNKRMKVEDESNKNKNNPLNVDANSTNTPKLHKDDNVSQSSDNVFIMPQPRMNIANKQVSAKDIAGKPVAFDSDYSESGIKLASGSDSNMEVDEKSQEGPYQYNSVSEEEMQKLREFQVLDEVNEDDSKDEDSDASDNSDLPDDEIEKMLEEDLPEGFKGTPKPKEKAYVTRDKIILEEKGINQFEVLPLDWMMVKHCSGMPVYLHRSSRVCTLAKPYFLGKGNTRRHDIPISAIPCLSYRKALEEEEKQKEIDKSIAEQIASGTWAQDQKTNQSATNKGLKVPKLKENQPPGEKSDKHHEEVIGNEKQETFDKSQTDSNTKQENLLSGKESTDYKSDDSTKDGQSDLNSKEGNDSSKNEPKIDGDKGGCPLKDAGARPVVLPGGIVMPPPRVETVNTSWKTQHLAPEQVTDYCKNLFKFKNVKVMHFKRWADRRKFVKARKTMQYPTLPEGTKLITIPAQLADNAGKGAKRDWVMNMNGCSYLSVFHEYVRRALQKQPVYEFKQLENAATPYQATVFIGGMQYGVGHGSSKRAAKSAAARASIHILIPEMKDELDQHARENSVKDKSNHAEPDFSFFDCMGIEDPRISEFCAATSEPSPHAILRTCLLRNFGAGDRQIQTEMKKLEYQKVELKMRVGKHSATVVCKNKKQAKQRASQAILQALHPHIKSWGSLLRLYGSRSVKSCKEKKLEEQQITLLQDKAKQNEPNYAVLEKLRNEMRKLKQRDEAVVPIGTFLVADDLPTHSGSMLNKVDL